MEQTSVFTVPEELEEERFDAVVASLSEGQSRSYLKNLIKDGSVLLNGKTAKPGTRVHENDVITLVLPEKIVPDILPENIPLDILYEDDDVLVVNKPKGMVVHPAPGHYSGTLVNAVMYQPFGNQRRDAHRHRAQDRPRHDRERDHLQKRCGAQQHRAAAAGAHDRAALFCHFV